MNVQGRSVVDASLVLCPSLTFPASGSISLSTNGTQTVAIYACAAGYDLNGNSTRACNPDGTWTQAAPNCTCTSPAPPANGQVMANGVTATYRCNQGYSLNGLSTQTCGASGSGWSGSQPTCSTCVTLVTPTGGSVNLSTDGINTKVSYTCSLGYTLSGTSSITCRSDGTWDFTPPSCVQCPSLANPSSGTVTLSTNGFTTTASFSCGTGYFLSGAFTLTCNTGGTWSNNPPTCKCNFPAQPNNGQVTLSNSGTVASYRCNTGYTLAGLSSRTCQADGSGWEGSDPVCQMCNQLANPVSGNFTLSTNGTQTRVQYRCNVGTTLHGDISSVCKSDGTWENPSPVCVQCKQLNNPDSGSVALSTDGITTTATFSCVSGYTLNSTGVLACTISGNWDISSPFCICQSPPLVAHSELDISSDLRTATYTCNVGYVLVGSATRTCQANGTGWDGISPICDSPAVGESTDGSVWNVPIAVIAILIVVIVALVVVSIITTYMLCRMRKEKSGQVSPTVPGSVPGSREPSESDLLPEPRPSDEKASLLKKYQGLEERPSSVSSVIFATESKPPPLTKGPVQLPPISHVVTEKRKKKRLDKNPGITVSNKRYSRGTKGKNKLNDIEKANQVLTERTLTPDSVVRTERPMSSISWTHSEFNYIQPVYTPEPGSVRDTVISARGKRY